MGEHFWKSSRLAVDGQGQTEFLREALKDAIEQQLGVHHLYHQLLKHYVAAWDHSEILFRF